VETKATIRFNRIAPRKINLVASLVRGLNVNNAFNILHFTQNRGSHILDKLLKSAVSNAERRKDIDVDTLYIKRIDVGAGPTLKRFRPAPRGRAMMIRKRTSHITIILDEA
jgi:large subunit ribosomal protein L22